MKLWKIADPIKKLLAKLRLIECVWLEDHDGEMTLSIKRWDCYGPYAYRMWLINLRSNLLPDGTVNGPCYVKYWYDYK